MQFFLIFYFILFFVLVCSPPTSTKSAKLLSDTHLNLNFTPKPSQDTHLWYARYTYMICVIHMPDTHHAPSSAQPTVLNIFAPCPQLALPEEDSGNPSRNVVFFFKKISRCIQRMFWLLCVTPGKKVQSYHSKKSYVWRMEVKPWVWFALTVGVVKN